MYDPPSLLSSFRDMIKTMQFMWRHLAPFESPELDRSSYRVPFDCFKSFLSFALMLMNQYIALASSWPAIKILMVFASHFCLYFSCIGQRTHSDPIRALWSCVRHLLWDSYGYNRFRYLLPVLCPMIKSLNLAICFWSAQFSSVTLL